MEPFNNHGLKNPKPKEKVNHKVKSDMNDGPNKQEKSKKPFSIWWWSPPEDALGVEFCESTTTHGLPFIGKSEIHLLERIFWAITFALGLAAAVYLINDMWQRYYKNPVIVTFQSGEVDIEEIPFPAVSICNINAFPRSKVQSLEREAKIPGPKGKNATKFLTYVNSVCNPHSFSKEFNFAFKRGEVNDIDIETGVDQKEFVNFILNNTIDCHDLIHLCVFGEKPIECKDLFKPIITDSGKCCTFNLLPLPLRIKQNSQVELSEEEDPIPSNDSNPALGSRKVWSKAELDWWSEWDYREGFVITNTSMMRPYRQKRAGMPYGLSILLDPHLDEWYCPLSDAKGFRFMLHNVLENPHISAFSSFLELDKEVFIEIHPDMTNADSDIRDFKIKDRNCYFPREEKLTYFIPYTGSHFKELRIRTNCVEECTGKILEKRCQCTFFYMLHGDKVNICDSDSDSDDYKCIEHVKDNLPDMLKAECAHCGYNLCDNIEYHFETTYTDLQDSYKLFNDVDPEKHPNGPPPWANNTMSIVHLFMGSETVVPKLRTRLYGTADLIASTGGLLGLCLGVSILSVVEFFYFVSIRFFWKYCWTRLARRKRLRKKAAINSYQSGRALYWSGKYPCYSQTRNNGSSNTIIELDPNQISIINQSSVDTNVLYQSPFFKDIYNM